MQVMSGRLRRALLKGVGEPISAGLVAAPKLSTPTLTGALISTITGSLIGGALHGAAKGALTGLAISRYPEPRLPLGGNYALYYLAASMHRFYVLGWNEWLFGDPKIHKIVDIPIADVSCISDGATRSSLAVGVTVQMLDGSAFDFEIKHLQRRELNELRDHITRVISNATIVVPAVAHWRVFVANKEFRAPDLQTIQRWCAEGRIPPSAHIIRPGSTAWLRADELPETMNVLQK